MQFLCSYETSTGVKDGKLITLGTNCLIALFEIAHCIARIVWIFNPCGTSFLSMWASNIYAR